MMKCLETEFLIQIYSPGMKKDKSKTKPPKTFLYQMHNDLPSPALHDVFHMWLPISGAVFPTVASL